MYEMINNIWHIASKPDNIPIVGMIFLMGFFFCLVVSLARRNDRIRARNALPLNSKNKFVEDKEGVISICDVLYSKSEQGFPKKVLTWPHLINREMLAILILTVLLIVWSITIDAPLEEPANPSMSPNPAKAPWYFVGLQEMLVYFDPWIAGVMIPIIIVLGLMAIPYIDINSKGKGYYTLKERKFAISTFFFGFFFLWLLFIIIGTFLRGPGWIWFWPWEKWELHRVVAETNINLNEFIGNLLGISSLKTESAGLYFGATILISYYVLGFLIPYIILKRRRSPTLQKLGMLRYSIVSFLFCSMMGLPIKVFLRLIFSVKYVWVTPWFNV
jgi:hypothetical protein